MPELAAVTGAEGFIGSHLVEALVARGIRVRAMVLYNSFSSWGWLETLPPEVMSEVEVVLADVRDSSSVLDFMGRGGRRLPPGRADRDPVLLPGALVLPRHERSAAR